MVRYRFLIYLFVNCIIWLKSNGQAFDNICSKHPTIVGSRTDNQNDRSAFYIASHEDPRYQYRYSIQADRNSRFGSNLHIRAAILRATNQDNVIIGSWDTLNGPFIEEFCNHNDSAGDETSVAVMSGYTYPISSLEAVWVPPAFKVASPIISGFVYDSKRRVHRLDAVPALNSVGWYANKFFSLEECGSTKGCYLVPPNCALHNCLYALTWQSRKDYVKFEIMGIADGWVGVGFTNDGVRSDDEYTVCMRANDDSIVHKVLHMSNGNANMHDIDNTLIDNNKRHRGIYIDQRIYCTFTKRKTNTFPMYHMFGWLKSLSDPHYIIATFGDRGDIVGDLPNIYKSSQPAIVSRSRVNFNREAYPRRGYISGSWLAKIHMCLMIIAWVLLASIAVLTSRYYRPIWNLQSQHYGKKSWLTTHQPLIISVAILTVIAFIFILFEVNWGWPHYGNQFWHAFLGVIVVILAIINAALVLCVPKRHGRAYCIWFWIHWFVSSLAHCLAIPVIFLGMDLPSLDLWDWCSWLLMAWCIFHIITDLILEIHYCMTYRRSYERFEELDSKNRKFDRVENRYPPGYQWKPFCLGFYIVVTMAVVITLIIAIIVYD